MKKLISIFAFLALLCGVQAQPTIHGSSNSGIVWGQIAGNVADQADLAAAIAAASTGGSFATITGFPSANANLSAALAAKSGIFTTLAGYGITDGIQAATVNSYFANPTANGSFSAAPWRTGLGLVIGTNVQAYSANLGIFSGITPSANIQALLGAANYSAAKALFSFVPADVGLSNVLNIPQAAAMTVGALGSNALALAPKEWPVKTVTWTSNQTLTFTGGSNLAGDGQFIDATVTTPMVLTVTPTSSTVYRNGSTTALGAGTISYPVGHYYIRYWTPNTGATLYMDDTLVSASDVPYVVTPTNYTPVSADVAGNLVGIDTKIGTLIGGGGVAAFGTINLWATADIATPLAAGWLACDGTNGTLTLADVSGGARYIVKGGGAVAAPTFSPVAGTYGSTQNVTISSATAGSTIKYTVDGVTTPTRSVGSTYSTPVTIAATTTLKAMAYRNLFSDSTVTSGLFTIGSPTVTVTDTFVGTNTSPVRNPMSDGTSTWTQGSLDGGTSGGIQNFAGQATGATSGENFGLVALPTSIGSKQYAQFTVVAQGGSDYDGGVLYGQGGGTSNCYFAYFNGSATQIILAKRVANVNTPLHTWTVAAAVASDVDRIRVDPSSHTFTLSINGSDQSGTVVDTTYTVGQPGIYVVGTATKVGTFTAGTW